MGPARTRVGTPKARQCGDDGQSGRSEQEGQLWELRHALAKIIVSGNAALQRIFLCSRLSIATAGHMHMRMLVGSMMMSPEIARRRTGKKLVEPSRMNSTSAVNFSFKINVFSGPFIKKTIVALGREPNF